MKTLTIIMSLILSSCAYGEYRNGPVKIQVWSLGTDFNVNPASDVSDKFGNHTIRMKGFDTEQSKTVSDSAGKIMQAIIEGAKP